MVFTKTEQTLVWRWVLQRIPARTLALPSSIFQCIGFIGQRHGTTVVVERCSGKASIGSMTKSVESTSRFYTFQTGCEGQEACVRPSHHGWSGQTLSVEKSGDVTMEARSNLECGSETIAKSKRFKLYYVTVPTGMDHG
ncbi:hypothetical protein TNCV_2258751 [Trichonephila clavipes]|nr:hypothetical protein TNCV_2258751 [Trichonephila clavipes]